MLLYFVRKKKINYNFFLNFLVKIVFETFNNSVSFFYLKKTKKKKKKVREVEFHINRLENVFFFEISYYIFLKCFHKKLYTLR